MAGSTFFLPGLRSDPILVSSRGEGDRFLSRSSAAYLVLTMSPGSPSWGISPFSHVCRQPFLNRHPTSKENQRSIGYVLM